MTQVVPFKGLLYNSEKVGDMSSVMAPPYDVISPELQDALYLRHPDNIVRLILGKIAPDDNSDNNRYVRAAKDFRRWRSESVLIQDELPSIYFYVQTYTLRDGEKRTRKGFIARVRLEEFGEGSIYPHEKTLSGPKEDRFKLMDASRANYSCIFSIYSDQDLNVNGILEESIGAKPLIEVTDDEGLLNKMWRVNDASVIQSITAEMASKKLFIADGHHRYETALKYRNIMREKSAEWNGNEPENFVMMYFSNMDDEGMTILPTHRVIHGMPDLDVSSFLEDCSAFFNIEEIDIGKLTEPKARRELLHQVKARGENTFSFGLYLKGIGSYFCLTLKDGCVVNKALGDSIPIIFKDLDVTLLHSLVINKLLGIDEGAQERQENIIYKKDSYDAMDAVKEDCQIAFLLNPIKIEQMKHVSEAGLVLPQKTTYFYPKLLTGLVINPMD